jgi:hypothetical protein
VVPLRVYDAVPVAEVVTGFGASFAPDNVAEKLVAGPDDPPQAAVRMIAGTKANKRVVPMVPPKGGACETSVHVAL